VQNLTISRLCKRQVITVVNGSLPGPTVRVKEGDSLVIHVINNSPHNITIHWHGIFHRLTVWADGPSMITQCPIQPAGHRYAYRFNITGQEGTLWWHAHSSFLRATVYGAIIIRPKSGHSYPFPKPHKEVPIIFGEWWNTDVVALEEAAIATGVPPNNSDAYTINGLPGNLYPCSKDSEWWNTDVVALEEAAIATGVPPNNSDAYTINGLPGNLYPCSKDMKRKFIAGMFNLDVVKGKLYLLRIINAAMNMQLFFKIANHKLTVVAVDAVYTKPYLTDVIVIAPGQTVDALLHADQSIGSSYYMAAHPYASTPLVPFPNTTTRGVIHYIGGASKTRRTKRVLMPKLPSFFDTPTAHRFYSNLTSLVGGPHWVPVPHHVDEEMLVLNIPTKINKGTVEIITPVELIKQGDKVGSSEAALLAKLGIRPFSYGLVVQSVYDNGSVFSPEVLDLTEDDLVQKFAAGISMVTSLALAISFPTLAAAPHMFINAYKNALAISVATEYTFPQAEKVKEFLKVSQSN
ncbi:hypothetical protein DY000_02051108, partial [Brassica cretica]